MDFRSLINKIAEAEAPNQTTYEEWKPTPEQEKWLGGANRQDPSILSRMPGTKPPVTYFKDPADQALAKQLGFPTAATQPKTSQGAQPAQKTTTQQKIEKLNQLVDKLVALRQQPTAQAAQPTASAPAKVTPSAGNTFTFQYKDGKTLTVDAEGKPIKEGQIAKDLIESFGYQYNEADLSMKQLGAGVASGAAKAGLAKAGAKTAAKLVPGAGSALSAMDAYNRWQEGDRSGAVISALAGIGWLVPGPLGWALGGGLDAANFARDLSKDSEKEKTAQAAQPKTADPKVIALQKFLKSQGADLGTTGPNKDGIDGVMGTKTRAAMDSIGLSESQRAQLEQMLSEAGVGAALGAAKNIGKNFLSGLKGGGLVQPLVKQARGGAIAGKVAPGARTALKTGRAIGKHPYAATAGAAGLAGYGLGSAGTDTPSTTAAVPAGRPGSPSASIAAKQTAQQTDWTDEQKELNRQIKDIAQELQLSAGNDPEVKKALDALGKKMSGITQSSGQAAQPEATPTKQSPSLSDWESKIGTYK